MNNLYSETLVLRTLVVELWWLGDSRWCDFPWRSANYFVHNRGGVTLLYLTRAISHRLGATVWLRTIAKQ